MAPKQQPQAQAQQPQEPLYPVIEAFVEKAEADDVGKLFDRIRDGLKDVKGPRADHAKKVKVAIERAEELLGHLIQVREKLEAQRKGGAKGRK